MSGAATHLPSNRYPVLHEVADSGPPSEHVCASLSAHFRQTFSVTMRSMSACCDTSNCVTDNSLPGAASPHLPIGHSVTQSLRCRKVGVELLDAPEVSAAADFLGQMQTYQRVGVTASVQAKKGAGQLAQEPLPKSYQPVTHRATQRLPSGLSTLPGRQMQALLSALREKLRAEVPKMSADTQVGRNGRVVRTQKGRSSSPSRLSRDAPRDFPIPRRASYYCQRP